MLDIKFIRENLELVREGARKKHIEVDLDTLVALDDKRRALLSSVEEKRAAQNKFSNEIAQAPDAAVRMGEMREIKAALEKEEDELRDILREWQTLMVQVPNIPDVSVPEGVNEHSNAEIRTWGDKPRFGGVKTKSHIELMQEYDMVDFERGTKISGFRGYVLKNDGALLNFALWQFVIDFYRAKEFTPMIVPSLLNRAPFLGTGYLPQGEEDLYKTQDGQYLAGTAEVATMGYYMEEILEKEKLPVKLFSFSSCFRREAGSHGKDTKGLMRVHEFFKFEQVVLCEASHEESVKWHEAINRNAEEMLEQLEIPYRTVINCGGDLGLGQVKKYDIELWIPSEGTYREIGSASYFHDFQSRRLNIRYKDAEGKMKFVHSLNSTALPTPRFLIALIENNQKADGSIRIPPALQKYFGKEFIAK